MIVTTISVDTSNSVEEDGLNNIIPQAHPMLSADKAHKLSQSGWHSVQNAVELDPSPQRMRVEAELLASALTVQVLHSEVLRAGERQILPEKSHRLELSMTPGRANSRICFVDRWSSQRFEKPGRLILMPAGEAFAIRSDHGSQISIICRILPELFRHVLGNEIEWTDERIAASLSIPSRIIQNLLVRLGEEAQNPGMASQAISMAIATQLVVELGRYYASRCGNVAMGGLSPWQLRAIDERLTDLSNQPSLTELAGLCRVSVRHLCRGFRINRGRSVGEYLLQSRIETGKRHLLAGQSVKSIAAMTGYLTASSFCCAFRRETGLSPRQYIHQMSSALATD